MKEGTEEGAHTLLQLPRHINVTLVFYSQTTLTVSHKWTQMRNVNNDMAGNGM